MIQYKCGMRLAGSMRCCVNKSSHKEAGSSLGAAAGLPPSFPLRSATAAAAAARAPEVPLQPSAMEPPDEGDCAPLAPLLLLLLPVVVVPPPCVPSTMALLLALLPLAPPPLINIITCCCCRSEGHVRHSAQGTRRGTDTQTQGRNGEGARHSKSRVHRRGAGRRAQSPHRTSTATDGLCK